MKTVPGELSSSGETKPRRRSSWPLSRWLWLIALVLVAHLALIFIFGGRKPITPRPVTNVPRLELTDGSAEWLALNNPTLFALPQREGFAGPAWLEPPPLVFQWPEWATETPRWLQLPAGELGAVFSQFMQTNRLATFRLPLRPPPRFTVPVVPLEPVFAQTSTLRVEGDLAKRHLLTPLKLPSWPYTDILQPSKVQVLVSKAGYVMSEVLLSSSGDDKADQHALEVARAARFAPAASLTIGKLIFDWRTVPTPATNAPAK